MEPNDSVLGLYRSRVIYVTYRQDLLLLFKHCHHTHTHAHTHITHMYYGVTSLRLTGLRGPLSLISIFFYLVSFFMCIYHSSWLFFLCMHLIVFIYTSPSTACLHHLAITVSLCISPGILQVTQLAEQKSLYLRFNWTCGVESLVKCIVQKEKELCG